MVSDDIEVAAVRLRKVEIGVEEHRDGRGSGLKLSANIFRLVFAHERRVWLHLHSYRTELRQASDIRWCRIKPTHVAEQGHRGPVDDRENRTDIRNAGSGQSDAL